MKKLTLFLSFGLLMVSCSKNDISEANPIELQDAEIVQTESDIITTSEELDSFLEEAGINPAEVSVEEKLDFLSDKIAKEYFASINSTSARSVSQILCIAQAFDGTNYKTDVDTGTSNEKVSAYEIARYRNNLAFVAGNANVYEDSGSGFRNIWGRSNQESNTSCQYDVKVICRATRLASGGLGGSVVITCDDWFYLYWIEPSPLLHVNGDGLFFVIKPKTSSKPYYY